LAKKGYVAVVGCRNYFEPKMLKPGLVLKLIKEPENLFDEEAIRAELAPIGKIGYVANSIHTVPRGCYSAGRIYDSFETSCRGIIRFVVGETVILELIKDRNMEIIIYVDETGDRIDDELFQGLESQQGKIKVIKGGV